MSKLRKLVTYVKGVIYFLKNVPYIPTYVKGAIYFLKNVPYIPIRIGITDLQKRQSDDSLGKEPACTLCRNNTSTGNISRWSAEDDRGGWSMSKLRKLVTYVKGGISYFLKNVPYVPPVVKMMKRRIDHE